MKKFIFLVFPFLLLFSVEGTFGAVRSDVMCTMQYAPVCASVQVQCIQAPCDPVRQTFGNACMAWAAWATDIITGECESSPVPPVVVWGDRDIHGCIGSAGYSWNGHLQSCVRPWEAKTLVLNVASEPVSCSGVGQMQCLELKKGKKRELFYDTISGFEFVSGYNYRLLVKRETVENPPQDASKYHYTLLKILSKKSVTQNDLTGTKWVIHALNGIYFASGSLEFSQNRIFAKFCNNISGEYTAKNSRIQAPMLSATRIYCIGGLMDLEDAFQIDQAKYLRVWDTLSITTKTGDVFVFKLKK